ncbi:MAG: carbohydrate ABC transporter permease [Actinobacteria bacterium]|nr:carbohydrate ABC transporter permease [Actinomycetota bacterium]
MTPSRFALSRAGILLITGLASLYFIIPIWWFVVASTKSSGDLFSTNGLWFAVMNLGPNLARVFSESDGIFLVWMRNSLFYGIVGAGAGTLVSAMAGYALAQYRFRGREAVFNVVLGSVLIPTLLLTIPLYLVFSAIGLINTVFAVLLPIIINPFGIYLARIYAVSVPDEVIEAARIDGAGEFRIFFTLAARIMAPALATIFLILFVGVWSNFFLPQMMLIDPQLQPLALGIVEWQSQLISGAQIPSNIVICAALVSVLPLVALFLAMQRFLRAGLAAGSIK